MKTAIYIRVSTEEQAREGYSIDGQKQKLKAFCMSQGWEVVGLYPDQGISAKDTNRPQLQQMLQDIRDGKVNCVLVYRLDRLTRSVFDLYKLLEVFEQYDCKFKSATEVYDTTTAMGRMFITIVAALAQWERENMGERISFGYIEKARQGKYPHPFPPFGYDLDKEESRLYVNAEQAKTVKLIFELYQTMGMNQVAGYLNSRRMLTRKNNYWSDNTIMKALRNRVYCGDIEWLGEIVENTHDPIIDKETWKNTQDIISRRASKPPQSVSSRYIFSGKLKCPSCGKPLTGCYTTANYKGNRSIYLQYRCRRKSTGRCSGTKNVSESKLEKAFLDFLEREGFKDPYYKDAAASAEKDLSSQDHIDIEGLQKQLDKIEKRKKKWQYAWSDDLITTEDFKNLMDEAEQDESKIKEELTKAEPPEKEEQLSQEELEVILKDLRLNWSYLEQQEKKNLIDQIVKQIHYKHDGNKIKVTSVDF